MKLPAAFWHSRLREERERLNLTRQAFARLVGVPTDTLRRWEDGTRRPSEPRLRQVLEALKLTGGPANDILVGAGYNPQPTLFPNWRFPAYFYKHEELASAVGKLPWPAFVLDHNVEVIAANDAVQALWRIDFAAELSSRTRAQMNMLSVASDHHFSDRLVNWDECVAVMAATFKGQPQDPESLDQPSAYLNAVLAEFASGDPQFLRRMIEVFAKTPGREPKVRWEYPVVWRDDDFGEMRFMGVVTTASEPDGLGFNDWHPLDADTWSVLENVKRRHAQQLL